MENVAILAAVALDNRVPRRRPIPKNLPLELNNIVPERLGALRGDIQRVPGEVPAPHVDLEVVL